VERELTSLRDKIEKQRIEASRFSGGLVRSMGEVTLATLLSMEALLEKRRLELKERLARCATTSDTPPGGHTEPKAMRSTDSDSRPPPPEGAPLASTRPPCDKVPDGLQGSSPRPPAPSKSYTILGSSR
jgi:hypothetical protein